jgi:DNA polymerase III subunit epsilon
MRLSVIDFETANRFSQSACSIGIVVFEDGELIHEAVYLIKPHRRYRYFDPMNISIHHITPDMVKNASEFDEVVPFLIPWMDNAILAAHYAPFDASVLRSLIELYQVDFPKVLVLDTVEVARKCYPRLINHKLHTVCNALEIPLDHHEALSDARGAALLVLNAMSIVEVYDPIEFANTLGIKLRPLL